MKGLDISKRYFFAHGLPMLKEQFDMVDGRLAAGLVGHGSECFSFDDAYSVDHDYGPSFCIWLTEEDFALYGKKMQEAYEGLPKEFDGMKARTVEKYGGGRVGVFSIPAFYYGLLGREDAPDTLKEWMMLPEERLALAVNGTVFLDQPGTFSTIREQLLQFYPEDVRIKKIAARAAGMAQSGQYNYARAMKRGELVAASLALSEFIKCTTSMVYLLNKQYAPFYKWMHRGMQTLIKLPRIYEALQLLVETDMAQTKKVWAGAAPDEFLYTLNTADVRVVIIEGICGMVISELKAQGLTTGDDNFLETHVGSLMNQITDPYIRSLQTLIG